MLYASTRGTKSNLVPYPGPFMDTALFWSMFPPHMCESVLAYPSYHPASSICPQDSEVKSRNLSISNEYLHGGFQREERRYLSSNLFNVVHQIALG